MIQALQGRDSFSSNSALIRRIQTILSQENRWSLHYIPRAHNQDANFLAKQALSTSDELQFFDIPSQEVDRLLELDKMQGFFSVLNSTM